MFYDLIYPSFSVNSFSIVSKTEWHLFSLLTSDGKTSFNLDIKCVILTNLVQ